MEKDVWHQGLIEAAGGVFLSQACVWFLKIDPVRIICMCVCVCVCVCVYVPTPEAINN